MKVKLAENYGFCFGVKRAIEIAEESKNSFTFGPLIHNPEEIGRLKEFFGITTIDDQDELQKDDRVIIRTHGIPKNELFSLKEKDVSFIDATCPFVKKPQEICETMSQEGYDVVIFGDKNHPEVKGVQSYVTTKVAVVLNVDELQGLKLSQRVAVVSQTTRQIADFTQIVDYLVRNYNEVRVFNTICNATLDNQDAALKLASEVDVMVVIGGKNSSNTKQLFSICQQGCTYSYLIERASDLQVEWFEGKNMCGVTAGASTPDWIISEVVDKIREF